MRLAWMTSHLLLGAILAWMGSLALVGLLARAPGSQAIDMASIGVPITPDAHRRATAGLGRALAIHERHRFYRELGFVHHNLGRQPTTAERVRANLYEHAVAALRYGLRLSPVDPVAWLLVAQMHYERGETAEAAEAFDWSLRTGHFLGPHAVARSFLGLGVWRDLREESRNRLMPSIMAALGQRSGVEVMAAWAVEVDLDAELVRRLREQPDGLRMAEEFATASAASRASRRLALDRLLEGSSMRRALAAGSLVLTVGLPMVGQAMTINDYLASVRGEPFAADETSVNDYLIGVLDGLVMLGAVSREQGAAVFCPPDPSVMTVDLASFRADLDAMLAELEAEVPGFGAFARTRSLGLAALQLLTLQHPCGD